MTEWIEWNGGGCPVDGDALVCVKLRIEAEENNSSEWDNAVIADDLRWLYPATSSDGDIIAYRIVEDNQ